jgi:hypothetical protein
MDTPGHGGANRSAVQQAQLLIQTGKVDDAITLLCGHLSSEPDDAAAQKRRKVDDASPRHPPSVVKSF